MLSERHWLAIGVLGAGAIGILSTYLYVKGKRTEAFVLGTAATLTSTIFAAAKVLQEPEPPKVYVLPSGVSYGPSEIR